MAAGLVWSMSEPLESVLPPGVSEFFDQPANRLITSRAASASAKKRLNSMLFSFFIQKLYVVLSYASVS